MPALDLTDLPVVDNHCHGVDRDQDLDVADWRSRCTEAPHAWARRADATDTACYRRLVRAAAAFHDLPEPYDEAALLAARAIRSAAQLTRELFRDAGIAGLVVDTGYPEPDRVLGRAGLPDGEQVELLRVELLLQDLVARHDRLDAVVEDLRDRLGDLRASGWAGLKSIVGYRTGLDVARWQPDEAQAAFVRARAEVGTTGQVRLGHKPLLDTLLHVALLAAASQEVPVQFHVGYGDPDVDLRTASPLGLRALLEEPAYRGAPIVLLHGCWPYVREGAFLAAVYENAYLDLSYGIPFLSLGELTSMTRAALGAAPFAKLMYSSDGAQIPELHWLGARDGRRVLGRVLDELVVDGDLDQAQARDVAGRILGGTAWQLYGFAGDLS